ncbi:MAG: thiamine pyrophosphate-binding protein, partial [Chloroflexales bacterium]|nr:thiamine pyrophosphate-binding protein [Chloroflexales bacterium]
MHGGDLIASVLEAQGTELLFTLCGGHISPILVGAKARGIRVIDTRHEATAVFAADAVARLTGRPGVVAVTAGPGLTNTITAVKNAQIAQSPVVLLGGAAATVLKGRGSLQDIDQMALLRPHVKWAGAARRVADLIPLVEQAFAVAQAGVPGPAFVECPIDLLYGEAEVRRLYGAVGRGRSLSARATGLYLQTHLTYLFAGAEGRKAGPRIGAPA